MRGFRSFSNSKSRDTSVPDSGNHIHHVNEPSYPTKSLLSPTIQPSDGPYEDSTKIVRQEVLSLTQKPPIADIEINEEDPPKTAETLTEVTTESIGMAASGSSSIIGKLKDQVKKNKEKIEDLERQLEVHKNCDQKTKTLKDEIKKLEDIITKLREKNDYLTKELRTLKQNQEKMSENYDLLYEDFVKEKEARRSMETEYDAKLKCLTENEDLLCLRQLGVDVQVHIYKYVMREDYDEIFLKPDIDKIDNNIDQEIKDPEKKTRAKERLQILKGKKFYQEALSCLGTLIKLKRNGNITAHPELNIEKIKQSIVNLRKDNKLKDERYEDVKKLAKIWTESKSLLDSDDRDEDEH